MGRRLTNDEFVERMKKINSNIIFLEEYQYSHIKIKCKCLIDCCEWSALSGDLFSGQGCPECGRKSMIAKNSKTHSDFIKELKIINPNIQILSNYTNNKTKVDCKCLKHNCGHIWSAIPNSLLQGHGCPQCGGWIKRSHEEFVDLLKTINPNIIVVDKYKNRKSKIKCKCKIDNNEWYAMPYHLLKGVGCPICGVASSADGRTKSYEEFVKELQQINPNIEIVGQYNNTNTKVKCRCSIDGYEWEALPNNLLQGHGCPKCNNPRGENKIIHLLNKHQICYVAQKRFEDCKNIKPLPFDFYLPNYHMCIEYDGVQHYEPIERFGGIDNFQVVQKHDKIKTQYCQTNNIKLLRIPYWEFDNIENILVNELGLSLQVENVS